MVSIRGISWDLPPEFPSFPPKILTPCVVNDVSTDIKDSSVILVILLVQFSQF